MNPIIIEQDHESVRRAIALHRNSSLQQLRLVAANLSCNLKPEDADKPLEIAISFHPAAARTTGGLLTLAIDFAFTAMRAGVPEPEKDVIVVQCRFEVDYQLRPEYQPSDAETAAFHAGNAIFNCWPYFREYVQSSVTRMGVSPPPIPFLRVQAQRAPALAPVRRRRRLAPPATTPAEP